jgi:signal transduction histidine kinase
VQNIAAELRPSVLDHLGLPMAIQFEAERFHKRSDVTVKLRLIENVAELKPEVASAMFRIFQEALTNVARHSEATELDIRLSREDENFVLIVKDNGKGISTEALKNPRSLGLVGMKERASLLGGTVTFESPAGGGTLVRLEVPKAANDTKFWELV